jgi:isopenicillin N synthase-like dioxygenase
MAPIAIDSQSSTNGVTPHTKFNKAEGAAPAPSAFTLDFSQWTGPNATKSSKNAFIQQLREASAGLGFFYLLNTPLDQGDLRKRIFDLNEAFFALPLHVRQQISIVNSPHFRGFSKFGDERTQDMVDHRDQIDYGLEYAKGVEDKEILQKFPFLHLLGPNQFLPDDILPGHRELVLRWLDICQDISLSLTEALEVALGAPKDSLVQFLTGQSNDQNSSTAHRYARMKTIRYPRAASIDGIQRLQGSTQGVGAHKDGGWITILATSPHRGLQVQSYNGDWIDVDHHPHGMVVNFGQQIERVSRGAITAAAHRVLSHTEDSQLSANLPSGDRYSVAYFSTPALNVVVRSLPSDSFSPEILSIWQKAQEERKKAGLDTVVTDIPKGDLWGQEDDVFGFQAWKGIVRSHPNVVERYNYTA